MNDLIPQRMLPLQTILWAKSTRNPHICASNIRVYFTTKCDSKKEYKKQNLTKQNKNKYSNSLSLQFVLCIFTTHYSLSVHGEVRMAHQMLNAALA